MSPEFQEKWENILQDIEKSKVPIFFIKKIILKLNGKRQKTINVEKLILQGLDPTQLENVVSKQLEELSDDIIGVEFNLNVEAIAEMVQPETDRILQKL